MHESDVRRVTLRDVAAEVGLSVNTVSRALTGKDSVGQATRERIQAAADRMGYVPNSMARSLVLGATMTLGLIITLPSNPFYAQLISAVEQRVRQYGYSLLLVVSEERVDNEERAVEDLLRWGVGGVLVVPVQGACAHLRRLEAAGVPVVLLNRDVPELGTDFVGIDNAHGIREVTGHLIDRGARRIVLLEEDLRVSTVLQRREAFTEALAAAGLVPDATAVLDVPSRRQGGDALPWEPREAYAAVRDLLASDTSRPDAIVVGNDYLALGVYRAVAEAGLRVPDDILVAGYGDHPYAAYLTPPLTTVRLPAAEIGEAAVDLAVRRLRHRGEGHVPRRGSVRPELVVRASTTGITTA